MNASNYAMELTATRFRLTFVMIKTLTFERRSASIAVLIFLALDVDEAQCHEHVNAKGGR